MFQEFGNEIETEQVLTILDNLKCEMLGIGFRHIGTEETKALVRAMKRVVKRVILNTIDTIDFDVLIQYDGKGECERLEVELMTDNESECIKAWAKQINWNITEDLENQTIVIERKKKVDPTLSFYHRISRTSTYHLSSSSTFFGVKSS